MKNFGVYKSKVEKILMESYAKGTFKESITKFKKIVLEDKNLSQIFFLYDQLSSNKGMSKDYAKEFLDECVNTYKNLKISKKTIKLLEEWVSKVDSENNYLNIDNIFEDSVINLENKINSKKLVLENLTKSEVSKSKEIINIPLKSAVSMANKSLSNYIETLSESDKKELLNIIQTDKEDLEKSYTNLKENTLDKLKNLLDSSSDSEINKKLSETINKIQNENFDNLNYYRLKKLNETI